jgi:Kef-type K+ transport system membrane component KefB
MYGIGFVLFCGTSMSFTAFPVLASILNHLHLLQKPIGVLAISIASVDDILAWCVLAIASSFVRSNDALFGESSHPLPSLAFPIFICVVILTCPLDLVGFYTFLLAVAYVLIMLFLVRPFLRLAYQKFYNPGSSDGDNRNFIVCVFLYLCVSAFTCETMVCFLRDLVHIM